MVFRLFMIVAPVAACLVGCAAPQRTGDLVQQQFEVTGDQDDQDRIWEQSTDVLRRQGFKIDRYDRRAGVVTTFPQTSGQFFEFWRKDTDTPYDWLEASLRTVRRSVTLESRLDESGEAMLITVTVHRETFATPERQFNNSLAAFRMFGDELPGERTGGRVTRADSYWIPDGRDPAMEAYLMKRIAARIRS